ncbi:hypothetical protein C2G38_2221922 [Gigaspora rosea]|uniref:Uncharacterized protein n=1 Tax=Gigaspora rosea TaxID=44941 RepID=A0A397UBB3_9GLOM|nr:hypothetical protein C2G38_2221922 [Gigaspora rosea]
MNRKKFSKEFSKKKINSKAQSKFNDSCYADFLSLSKKIDDELNFFPCNYSFIIFQMLRLFNKFTTYDLSDYNDIYKNFQYHRSNLEIIEINEREHFSYEIIQRLQEIFNFTPTKQIIKQNKQDLPEKLVKLQFLIFSCARARLEIVAAFEITDPNIFFVYKAVDASNYDDGHLLRLYFVLENGQKFFIDIIKYDIFFDIKLKDPSLLNSYLEEFRDYRVMINEISCSSNDFNFVLVDSEKEILLEFAKLNYLYQKDIEIGYNTGETKLRVIDNDVDKRMQKYQFAGLNINNRDFKAKKTFQNELKHTLAHILKKCKLSDKVDLSYIPDDNFDNLKCMFVYVSAIKFQNDELLLSVFATKLSKLCKIDYQKCFDAMSDSLVLEEYAIDLAYYCSVDTLRLQELLIK